MTRFLLLFLFLSLKCSISAQIEFKLEDFASGLSEPVGITNAGDARLFVVEKKGIIRIVNENGQLRDTAFLNIDLKVGPSRGEQGLLGLAFHPNYAQNGYFYVNYTNDAGNTHIARFRVSANNPNIADPASELVLLSIDQPYDNHNGGDLNFGPDGYLYIGMGDGGSGGDPENRSQNPQSLLGKMLRLDVNKTSPYIPADNPYVNETATRDEIWAFGLRNPWRFSFDRQTGDMWIGDVGQGNWEEISRQPANSKGGENYGWRCYEGDANFNTNGCSAKSNYIFPVIDYSSNGTSTGCSVTGGYVYRGTRYPNLQGHYIYADYCSGRFWSLRPDGQGGWINTNLLNSADFDVVAFGEDRNGELYVAGLGTGKIYRVVGGTTSTEEQLQIGKLLLAPNPAGDFIRISMDAFVPDTYQFRLLDVTGRLLREWREGVSTGYNKEISTKELAVGLYFLQVQKDGEVLTRKFQKI